MTTFTYSAITLGLILLYFCIDIYGDFRTSRKMRVMKHTIDDLVDAKYMLKDELLDLKANFKEFRNKSMRLVAELYLENTPFKFEPDNVVHIFDGVEYQDVTVLRRIITCDMTLDKPEMVQKYLVRMGDGTEREYSLKDFHAMNESFKNTERKRA